MSKEKEAMGVMLKSVVLSRLDIVKIFLIAVAIGCVLTLLNTSAGVILGVVGGLIGFSEIYGRVMTGRATN